MRIAVSIILKLRKGLKSVAAIIPPVLVDNYFGDKIQFRHYEENQWVTREEYKNHYLPGKNFRMYVTTRWRMKEPTCISHCYILVVRERCLCLQKQIHWHGFLFKRGRNDVASMFQLVLPACLFIDNLSS